MAKDIAGKARLAKAKADDTAVHMAAAKYVTSGLNNLNLKPSQKLELQDKLIPIVKRTIGAERSRAAVRGQGMVSREMKKDISSAKKKLLGGK